MTSSNPLVRIQNLDVSYYTDGSPAQALHNIDMDIQSGERVGLVGESGCGKSTLLKIIMGVLPPNGKATRGQILLDNNNLFDMSDEARRKTRWAEISMITQSALNALNPVQRIDAQIIEAIQTHQKITKQQDTEKLVDLFQMVGVDPARARDYPHQFSGGMRQRAMIAMAMSCNPKVLIADEPTTALDVTIQAQIFNLMIKLKQEHNTAIMLITHDMGVIAELADEVAVMYMGNIVEAGTVDDVLRRPQHPYTRALLDSIPVLGRGKDQDIKSIRGATPDPYERPVGCQFAPRCDFATDVCNVLPTEEHISDSHRVMCTRYKEIFENA